MLQNNIYILRQLRTKTFRFLKKTKGKGEESKRNKGKVKGKKGKKVNRIVFVKQIA